MNANTGFQPIRHDRLLHEQVHDTYKAKGKLSEPTVCTQCKAIFHKGHWSWGEIPEHAEQTICPACHRVNDHYPAGFVSLKGAFLASHSEEIINLVRHHAEREGATHPLKRIIDIENEDDSALITTTDIHLARGIGEAICDAYRGILDFHYNQSENLLRVHWTR